MVVINQKRSLLSRVGRWTAELVLVFVGVYGAFWLNNYQQHGRMQNGATRFWLRSRSNCAKASKAEKLTARNRNRKPRSFGVRSTPVKCRRCSRLFSPPITAQPTGLQCCNPEASNCLTCRRSWRCATDESVIRWGLSRMAWYQKLSDELIVPNLDQDISFFYDPATKKLRKRFEIYPEALDANSEICQRA